MFVRWRNSTLLTRISQVHNKWKSFLSDTVGKKIVEDIEKQHFGQIVKGHFGYDAKKDWGFSIASNIVESKRYLLREVSLNERRKLGADLSLSQCPPRDRFAFYTNAKLHTYAADTARRIGTSLTLPSWEETFEGRTSAEDVSAKHRVMVLRFIALIATAVTFLLSSTLHGADLTCSSLTDSSLLRLRLPPPHQDRRLPHGVLCRASKRALSRCCEGDWDLQLGPSVRHHQDLLFDHQPNDDSRGPSHGFGRPRGGGKRGHLGRPC